MDRLRSGLHRKSRKDSPQRPTIVTEPHSAPSSGKTTPEPGPSQPLQVPGVPHKKTSPFRALRDLGRSHKRARSPATGSETNTPLSALSVDRLVSSPHPLSAMSRESHSSLPTTLNSEATAPSAAATKQAFEMPSFLSSIDPAEIDAKFQDIQWMERDRMTQSMLNPSSDFRWARVSGDHLRKLDRYMNIQPWENNRVRLCVPAGKQNYINASPITLPSLLPTNEADRYIAMQGPKHKTTDHVWRMVVEQLESPAVVVMLTETHEGNSEKCWPYFPRRPEQAPLVVNKRDEFGDGFRASVRCEAIEETEAGDAIELRKLVIRVYKGSTRESLQGSSTRAENTPEAEPVPVDENGDVKMASPSKTSQDEEHSADENDAGSVTVETGRPPSEEHSPATQQPSTPPKEDTPQEDYEERILWHFLYKKWPDFGVPALEDLDSFFTLMRLSREKNASQSNPRIVHCSAGVGRSGTFIALDHLMREMDAGLLEGWDTPSHIRHQHRAKREGSASSTQGQNGHVVQDDDAAKEPETAHKMKVEGDQSQTEEGSGFEEQDDEAHELNDLVFHVVNQLREQRRNMVQADAQFLFIYQVLHKLWQDKYGHSNKQQQQQQPLVAAPSSERLMTPDGEPVAKRLEVDPFVETE